MDDSSQTAVCAIVYVQTKHKEIKTINHKYINAFYSLSSEHVLPEPQAFSTTFTCN